MSAFRLMTTSIMCLHCDQCDSNFHLCNCYTSC